MNHAYQTHNKQFTHIPHMPHVQAVVGMKHVDFYCRTIHVLSQ
jgi:hypothetical protein